MTRIRAGVAATLAVALISGCGHGLESLPLPAPQLGGDTYTLHAVFANALNLPARAKVKLAGADVGELEAISAKNYVAYTTMRIRKGTTIPVGSTAELRTATPLGDVFIALRPPIQITDSYPMLNDGDTIQLESTASAATVEDVLSSAAVLVNGGAIRNMTTLVNGLGSTFSDRGVALAEIIGKSNHLLETMNSRSGQFREALTETRELSKTLAANRDAISGVLQAAAPASDALASHTNTGVDLVAELSGTTRQLEKFPSIQGTDDRSLIADANTLSESFNTVATHPDPLLWSLNRLLPLVIKAASGPAIGGHLEIAKLAIGANPDIGYPGDPGFHGPKRADWDYLVGSLRYQLFRLQERVVGQGPDNP